MGIRIWGVEITAGDILIDVMGSTITAGLVTVGLGTGAAAWYAAALASGSVTLLTLIERQKRRQVRRTPRAQAYMFQHPATAGITDMTVQRRSPTPSWATGERDSVLRVRKGSSKSLQHKGTRVVATYEDQVTVRVFHPRDPQVHALSLPPQPNNAYAEVETATGARVLCRVAGVGANAVFLHVVFQGANDS